MPVLRRSGAGGGGGGEGGGIAPPGTGRAATRAGAVTADLAALRERIAAITARPSYSSTCPSPSGKSAQFPSPSGGGEGGGARRLPADCVEETTPFGPVAVHRAWFPDQ